MSNPIHIDLRDLTPEKLAECKPRLGVYRYSAPCIIGTLVPEDERGRMDAVGGSIGGLLDDGVVTMPEDQEVDAIRLQRVFDSGLWHVVERIAAKWMGKAVSK
jgi:hypothetical protein